MLLRKVLRVIPASVPLPPKMYAYHNREEAYPQSLTLPRPMRVAPPHARPASTPSASGLRLVCLDRSAENILILAI